MSHFVNVLKDPLAGRLDEVPDTDRDLRVIRSYIQTEKRVALDLGSNRKVPSIARAVLGKAWQQPRVGFHAKELTGRSKAQLGNKLLLVPWSEDAFLRYQSQDSVDGLILEHVTPIDALWKELHAIDDRSGNEEDWLREAKHYLLVHFVVAVLTAEQAKAIDEVGMQKTGTPGKPFTRYAIAIEEMQRRASAGGNAVVHLDLTRFVHPGLIE